MKTTKRILVLALATLLALTLALPAFAAEEKGTIKVTRPENAAGTPSVYDVYQIFVTEAVTGGGHTYKLTTAWEGFTAPGYFSVNANGYVVWDKNTISVTDAAAVAQLAKAYAVEKSLTTDVQVTAGAGAVEVDSGYYLLVPANGPCGVIMVEPGEAASVEEKTTATGHPVVEKRVFEDSTSTYKETNSVDIGQVIKFQTTITAGVSAENYILHDEMDDHIEYTNEFVLLRDGNPLPQENNYEIVNNPKAADPDLECNCTFHVVFLEGLLKNLNEGAKIIVQYTGKLKPGADTATAHNNKTWVTYANGVPTNESVTATATFKVTVNKVDKSGNKLENAGFMLRDNIGLYYTEDGNGNVSWGPKENATTKTTNEEGVAVFYGLDAENFILEETVVPDGYTGFTETPVGTKVGDQGDGKDAEVTVTNTLGKELPETGGIGTTVFYVVGGLLVVCAVALLFVFKRRNAQ